MDDKSSEPATSVAKTTIKHRRRISRKVTTLAIAALVVFAGIVGLTYQLISQKQKPAKTTAPTGINNNVVYTSAADSKDKYLRDVSANVRYDALRQNGDYSQKQADLQAQLAKATTPRTKMLILVQQASTAVIYEKYDEAKMYATEAQQTDGSTSDSYEMLAIVALKKNDPATAKTNWQAALDHLDKQAENYDSAYREYLAGVEGRIKY